MESLICYCFGYTASDIERDVLLSGKSRIMERIMSEKKVGGCQCHKEPQRSLMPCRRPPGGGKRNYFIIPFIVSPSGILAAGNRGGSGRAVVTEGNLSLKGSYRLLISKRF